ncbi:hypothetical protein L596_006118 [Steinernema carpocapsae]|uniref:Uncharacterized protein n=1 Tax=Steinernema carpocapsae TaxID=34508 RepID=A0A4U8V2K5_STECR|nr:hypothetical protein L596_006118 [Steinernema carpocapsae]
MSIFGLFRSLIEQDNMNIDKIAAQLLAFTQTAYVRVVKDYWKPILNLYAYVVTIGKNVKQCVQYHHAKTIFTYIVTYFDSASKHTLITLP